MKFTFLRYTIYAAITYGLMEVMKFDAETTTEAVKFSETSIVEQLQNVFLIIALLFLAFSKNLPAVKYIIMLVLGLFFIREQDAFLDSALMEHGWKILCGIYAIAIGYKIYTLRTSIAREMENYMQSASSGILFVGLTTLLVFSRMFGRKKFWIAVEATEDYTRNVKNAAEECTELFGYFLILIGVIEFFFFAKKTLRKSEFI